MDAKTASSKIAKTVQAGIAACLLPVFFLYILLGKPDYKIMNAMSGVVVPAARIVGDGITWPVRAIGHLQENIKERKGIRQENRELRAKLDAFVAAQNGCIALQAENQRLEQTLDIVRMYPKKSVIARVIFENSAFAASSFILDKGESSGIQPGMAVISKDGFLAGTVISVTAESAKIRKITDTESNIPVRVAGSDVLGFLRGRGNAAPVFELFSDQEFSPTPGVMLLASGIGGSLPDGIPIGKIKRSGAGGSASVKLGTKTTSEAIVLIYK
ncbi:MAG: rod shape-determining protein MreC [Alphaproteobacteria bacterium]|nr:rod shape-determining protein MreC [Alphaproteobacteria bacterium]